MADTRTVSSISEQMAEFESRFGSNTICSAKWLQVTTLLYNGMTHSCHHNKRHKIDYEAVQKDPTLLHNTPEKILDRQEMRAGKRPEACEYCWAFEEHGNLSDRSFKSTNRLWSKPFLDRLQTDNPIPSFFEVAFDSTCNFKCMYCSPESSSKWMEEVKRHGAYPTSDRFNNVQYLEKEKRLPIPQREYNPYIEAFWKWWPILRENLAQFRITGGEPLLSKNTWRAIDELIEKPNKDMIFGINTNLGVEEVLIDKLVEKAKILEQNLKRCEVYTSCEAFGNQAEYIRFGLKYDQFIKNCYKILNGTEKVVLTFMTTISSLSLDSLKEFIIDVQAMQEKYPDRVYYDLAVLHYPAFMTVRLLDKSISLPLLEDLVDHLKRTGTPREVELATRLLNYTQENAPHAEVLKRDFAKFYVEYDKRRGTDFKKTFPHLAHLIDEHYTRSNEPVRITPRHFSDKNDDA